MLEIIPKKTSPLPAWLNILFYASMAILVFCISAFFITGNSIKNNQKALLDLEKALSEGRTEERISLEKEILKYQQKIEDFSKIIGGHLTNSDVFDFIQKNCHPKVWFTQFNWESEKREISLAGITQSFESLGQQILILKGNDSVKDLSLGKILINKEGKIEFSISFSLTK